MRILYITTVGETMSFFPSLIRELIEKGNIVDIATNESDSKVPECFREWGCRIYQISTSRSPLSQDNIRAIRQIRKIAAGYDVVHCHTPLAAMAARLACRPLRKNGLKVFYTAHGFHFFKGAPTLNWAVYYPIEWVCAYWTDVLITITTEDYELAKRRMHAGKVVYVPGVGIDTEKFENIVVDRAAKRRELGIPEDAFLILSVGELNENKNHQAVIKELAGYSAELNDSGFPSLLEGVSVSSAHYAIAGTGVLYDYLLNLAKNLGVSDRVHLLGYRNDCNELYKAADLYVLPSLREGLNVSLIEAKTSGLECRCYPIRGNVDIIDAKNVQAYDCRKINERMEEFYYETCNHLRHV